MKQVTGIVIADITSKITKTVKSKIANIINNNNTPENINNTILFYFFVLFYSTCSSVNS